MKRDKIILSIVVLLALVAASLVFMQLRSEAQLSSAASGSVVIDKLDVVLNNQNTILANLSSMQEELRIIKIRITQAQ